MFTRRRAAAIGWNAAGVLAVLVLGGLFLWSEYPIDYVLANVSTVTALATAVIILATLAPGSPLAWLLGQRPLTWIGKRSYALYLWHYPVVYVAGVLWWRTQPGWAALVAWAIAFTLAAASFRYIEAPALRLKTILSDSRSPSTSTARR